MPNEKKPKNKEIRLVWGSPDDLPAIYANHLQVSHIGGNEFHIFFGHATPPLTHGLSEDEIPDKVTIKPVAKIVVTPDMMRAILSVFAENLENFDKKVSKE